MILGYTVGTFDLLHIGHLRLLENCRAKCDSLLVGINSDEIVIASGKQKPIIPVEQRVEMVCALKCVDNAWIEYSLDKMEAWLRHRYEKFFVGKDWKGTDHWLSIEAQFRDLGIEIVYLPYTQEVSSTLIRKWCKE